MPGAYPAGCRWQLSSQRGVAKGIIEKHLLENAFLVGKNGEDLLAVVFSHAAGACAPEGEVAIGQVHHGLIDADTAGLDFFEKTGLRLWPAGKQEFTDKLI